MRTRKKQNIGFVGDEEWVTVLFNTSSVTFFFFFCSCPARERREGKKANSLKKRTAWGVVYSTHGTVMIFGLFFLCPGKRNLCHGPPLV